MAHPFSPSDDNTPEQQPSLTPDAAESSVGGDHAGAIDAVDLEPNDTDAQLATSTNPSAPDYHPEEEESAIDAPELDARQLDAEPNDSDAIPTSIDPEEEIDNDDVDLDGIEELDDEELDDEELDEDEIGDDEIDEDLDGDEFDDEDLDEEELDGEELDGEELEEESDEAESTGAEEADLAEARFSANVFLVGVPKGNRDDVTLRAIHTLQSVDLVVCEDFKSAARLLRNHNIAKKVIEISGNNEEGATSDVMAQIRAGKRVAILSEAGTPTLLDPGTILAAELREMKIEPRVVPGVSLVLSGLMASGFDMASFELVGFLPRKPEERRQAARDLSSRDRTLAITESPFRLRSLLSALSEAMPERRAAIAINLTTPFEVIVRGTLAQLEEKFSGKRLKGEFIIVLDALTPAAMAQPERPRQQEPRHEMEVGIDEDFGPLDAMSDEAGGDEEGGWKPVKKHPRQDRHDDRRGGFGEKRGGFGGERRDDRRGGFGGGERREGFGGERRDDRRGGFGGERRSFGGGERRDDRRGGFGGGERRSFGGERRDDRRGGFGEKRGGFGGERRDDRRGGFGGGERREGFGGERRDDRRGGFGGGERRDDRRGGFGGGERRDDRRGGFGGGERRDDRRGGFGGGERRSFGGGERRDDRRGGFGGGDRRDDRRGGFGERRGGFGGGEERGGGFRRDDRGGRPGGDRRGGFGRGPRGRGPGR